MQAKEGRECYEQRRGGERVEGFGRMWEGGKREGFGKERREDSEKGKTGGGWERRGRGSFDWWTERGRSFDGLTEKGKRMEGGREEGPRGRRPGSWKAALMKVLTAGRI